MRARISTLVLCVLFAFLGGARGATRYVDDSASTSGDGTSWQTAFQTIQEGIDAASDGDTVTVAEDTYVENIRFNGKNIALTSTDPLNPAVVGTTIIDGNQSGSVVTFDGTEDETCVLSGFTIQNGKSSVAGGGICGRPADHRTRATIQYNIIHKNRAEGADGGGLAFCDGVIQNNVIADNWAICFDRDDMYEGDVGGRGGGLLECDGTVRGNTITGNHAARGGAGLSKCSGTIEDNIISENSAGGQGGGLSSCSGIVKGNVVRENVAHDHLNLVSWGQDGPVYEGFPGWGGGLYACSGTVEANTISENAATGGESKGGGLCGCNGIVQGNVIFANAAYEGGGLCGCGGYVESNMVAGNSATKGGGLSGCNGIVQHNTICDNSAGTGGGLYEPGGRVSNCIIWGNTADESPQLYGNVSPTYSCVQGWTNEGMGNISHDPLFVDPDGPDDNPKTYGDNDYHLQPTSPCIDSGVNYYWLVWPQRDLERNCRLQGGHVDMGCYEYGSLPDKDGDLLSDTAEAAAGTDSSEADTDADGLRDGPELLRGTNPLVLTSPGILQVPGDMPTVQAALRLALGGEEIVVLPGTYRENLQFPGFDVVLRGTDPHDPDVVASTILDGNGDGVAVTFAGNESERCVLTGFTIQHGRASGGGGIRGSRGSTPARATLCNNVIIRNDGAAVSYISGTIRDNTIAENSSDGLSGCRGIIAGNSVLDNSGVGLRFCYGTIEANRVAGNMCGGLADCEATIRNNLVVRNSSDSDGGGLRECHGTIENNTIASNWAPYGAGLADCGATIRNCIIWGNGRTTELDSCSVPTYSCIRNWRAGVGGNIADYPHFVDTANGDYHLKSCSPCIDAGDPSSAFDREPEPNGGRINMGAYGNTPEAECKCPDSDEDALPDDWEMEFFGDLTHQPGKDADGDSISNLDEYRRGYDPTKPRPRFWYTNASVEASGDGTSRESPFKTAQEAIDSAASGETVTLAQGVYLENLVIWNKSIILQSENPFDPAVVANTILDGGGRATVVTLEGTQEETCAILGFTVRNGKAYRGGGILGSVSLIVRAGARISRNVITQNEASYDGGGIALCEGVIDHNAILRNSTGMCGGGLERCGGVIEHNTIAGNSAIEFGGGLYFCDGLIRDNVITGNSSQNAGGGLGGCDGTIEHNSVCSNSADVGGGLDACDGTIQGNMITGNAANWNGGGIYYSDGLIRNNVISGNSAGHYGGGVGGCDGTLLNNTIAYNSAGQEGGGLAWCHGTMINCIVWENTAPERAQLDEDGEPTYSCIQDWTQAGVGNIAGDPRFMDAENGSFRLRADSPCIDAGFNSPDLPEFDIAGMNRVMFGGRSLTVDMGAYEFYINKLEPVPGADEVIFTWSSLAHKTYSILWTDDPLGWRLAIDNFPSLGNGTTYWNDDGSLTGLPPLLAPKRFYRLFERP